MKTMYKTGALLLV